MQHGQQNIYTTGTLTSLIKVYTYKIIDAQNNIPRITIVKFQ